MDGTQFPCLSFTRLLVGYAKLVAEAAAVNSSLPVMLNVAEADGGCGVVPGTGETYTISTGLLK